MNPSPTDPVHFLQIWIRPDRMGVQPGYEQKHFADEQKRGRLRLVVSGDGAEGSVRIHQDARMHAGLFDGDEAASLLMTGKRRIYVHVVRGSLVVNDTPLAAGDALKLMDTEMVTILEGNNAEVLVFELPARA
jgi:redox-sensitive bicupin YhaK (pirin superfamily)